MKKLREEGQDVDYPVLMFMDFFVDDTPMVCVDGVGRAVLAAFAAILSIFNISAQGKKVLPDGNFASKGTAMGVDIDLGADPPVASIPDAKRNKALNQINPILEGGASSQVDHKDLEKLHGLLQWIGELLVAGRFHLVAITSAFRATGKSGSARVTLAFVAELNWWKSTLLEWNCIAIILPPAYAISEYAWADSPTTDACRSRNFAGAGAWFGGWYAFFEFTKEERDAF